MSLRAIGFPVGGAAGWSDLLSASFSGAQTLDVGSFFRPQVSEKWLVSAWIKFDPGGGGTIIGSHDPADPDYAGLDIALFPGSFHFYWQGLGGTNFHLADNNGLALSTGVWYHVLVAWDGSLLKWWLNGSAQSNGVESGTVTSSRYTVPTTIGNGNNWSALNGRMSQLLVATGLTAAVTNSDATRLYNSGRSYDWRSDPLLLTATGRADYWMGDGSDGATVRDHLGNNPGTSTATIVADAP